MTVGGITRDGGLIYARCVSQMYAVFADDVKESTCETGARTVGRGG